MMRYREQAVACRTALHLCPDAVTNIFNNAGVYCGQPIRQPFFQTKGFIMTTEIKRGMHPMMLAACIGLLLFCAVGVAAMMGWIPNSAARETDAAEAAATKRAALDTRQHAAPQPQAMAVRVATAAKFVCATCGVVESVRSIQTRGQSSGVGAVGGAVVGGLLGNQVGGGRGKDAMTVVGAVGGALAGNQIERNVKATTSYETVVRMENGSIHTISEVTQPPWQSGDHVNVVNGVIRS